MFLVKKIPVILDTDIGSDIDDTWALAMLLRSPELDLKYVTTSTGDTTYRAQIVAKMLEIAGRSDVKIGLGESQALFNKPQARWVKDYPLTKYSGMVYEDGIGAMIDLIMKSQDLVTLIAIGPLPTIAAALQREPRIATKVRFVGMQGSIYQGYGGSSTPMPEYNVVQDVPAAKSVFTAEWAMTITPLDTCGLVILDGDLYQNVLASQDPLTRAVVENYQIWSGKQGRQGRRDFQVKSSTLYDTVAIYLAYAEELLEIETLGIRVSDHGETLVDPSAKQIRCATRWKNMQKFKEYLVSRLVDSHFIPPR